MSLKIINRKIDDLIPYVRNARTHSDAQISQIAASIVEFGYTNPVLTDGNNGVVAGHGRLSAAKKLRDAGTKIPNWKDLSEIPTIDLAHLTSAQKKAYILTDNKVALNSSWDTELLKLELEDLDADGFDLELTGFSDIEIESFLGELLPPDDPAQAWDGMPAYEHEDQQSARKLIVHFAKMEDFHAFAKLIGQRITDNVKSIWYPEAEIGTYKDKRYVVEHETQDDES